MLPKIHKEGIPGHPIVSTCNCPTSLISEELETILSPRVTRLPTYIKDTNDAIRTFKQFEFAGQHRHLFTMDVTALYTSIPIKDGLQALPYFLNQHNTSGFSTTSIVRLAELVLNTASFEFNGAYIRQISGISMGTKFGPSFACLFMGYLEKKILETYTGRKPDLFKRYIDDCVPAASCSSDKLRDFIDYFANFHPAMKITFDISTSHLPF